jgi:predicted HTH transcriptional regulator
MPNTTISDAEILRRIKVEEDGFVKRKSLGDWKKDAVKTCVAFANSCSVDGLPGLLRIGVKDDGTIEPSTQNLDSVQKSFERELKKAYPEIPHQTRIVLSPEGKFLAVTVPGSTQGPHFSGPAYVRVGSQTVEASKEQFDRIIDLRDRKVREILKWKNKQVKVVRLWPKPNFQRIAGEAYMTVLDCDSFSVQLKVLGSDSVVSFSIEYVVLNRDPRRDALVIEYPND